MIGTRTRWLCFVLGAAALACGIYSTPVLAQEGGFPPWPIILDGHVTVDGQPLNEGRLSAQIDDWTSVSVPVIEGWFACAEPCLIVGPPSAAYVDSEVTFHVEGITGPSEYKFMFTQLLEPQRKTVRLEFSTGSGIQMWMMGGMGLLALAVGGGVVALMFRPEKRA